MPVIPHERADDRVVLLFHMGVVILVIRTRPGEGDPPGTAEANEMSIHELTPVVRMEGDHLSWVPVETQLQDSDDVDLCFRADGPLGPSGGTVRDGECPAEVAHRLSSIMSHQVHGQDPRDVEWRIHAGLNGNPACLLYTSP